MANIKLVIKIPEEILKCIKYNGCLSVIYSDEVAKAMINGTPLPKGHGDLVTKEQRWIPVSERLPEKNVEVLATTESGYITIAEWFEYDHWFIHEGSTNAHTDELTAWMPLPEPYKAESEVEK